MASSTSSTDIIIRNVFDPARDPQRELNLIVKVSDTSERHIWTEFEEFVLTDTLLQNLVQFHRDFTASITMDEAKMPFWLEGFYGSGKSHFSKIIGHLYQNSDLCEPSGAKWKAIDYFISHILDSMLLQNANSQNMVQELKKDLAIYPNQFNAKTIFINLNQYSKAEHKTETFIESFCYVLQKEFNQFLGLAENIQTAELEKNLIRQHKFNRFQEVVQELEQESWEYIRKTSAWAREVFIKAYSKMEGCDPIIAKEKIAGADIDSTQKTVVTILQEINEWIKNNLDKPEKGIVGKILIILDEAGFFFSTKESRIGEMMAVAEWINTLNNESHLNMIFSAQQSIKTYFESVKAMIDYRTAEQRFKHWFLDKKNIKTVVVNRWLKKDESKSGQILQKMLDDKYHAIIDGTVYDPIEDPNLDYIRPTKEDLFQTYPFIPDQFPLLIQVTQALISEQMVEEQYGGKTRSILAMVRDVLNNKLPNSSKLFIHEKLGYFVTLSQLYDTITYTLKNKDEDQFRIVESTKNLIENPSIFQEEERKISITFSDVAKTVLLLKYVKEICVNDDSITRALFYHVDLPKLVFSSKIQKLISELKKQGYITYKTEKISDKDGNEREITAYRIPSQEERKYIEKTHHVVITEPLIKNWLLQFFKDKEGAGKEIIAFRDQFYFQNLLGISNQSYNLDVPIRLKIEWYLDSELDEILGQISDDPKIASVCVFTNNSLQTHIKNLKEFNIKLQAYSKKAFDKHKILISIQPNTNRTVNEITQNHDSIIKSIEECVRYQETLNSDYTMPGPVQVSFQQRILDLKKDIASFFVNEFNSGSLIYMDRQDRIESEKINESLNQAFRQIYSQINTYAYLGQTKINKEEIISILYWDPKKKSKIPPVLKKGARSDTYNIPIYNEKDEFRPTHAEQYAYIINQFKEFLQNHSEIDYITGDELLEKFQKPPFSWNDQTILAIVAAIIRNNEWDPFFAGNLKNSIDKEIVDAFSDMKNNAEKFRNLRFKIAESISQEELTRASMILRNNFTEQVSQISREFIGVAIKKVLSEFHVLYIEIKPDLEKLQFGSVILEKNSIFIEAIDKILETPNAIQMIKLFSDQFLRLDQIPDEKNTFNTFREILNRIKDLKSRKILTRYYKLLEFCTDIVPNWLKITSISENKQELIKNNESILQLLSDPNILTDSGWDNLWGQAESLWINYWNEYLTLHSKLQLDIPIGLKSIEDTLSKNNIDKKPDLSTFRGLFTCKEKIKQPSDILHLQSYFCSKCNSRYEMLCLFEKTIKDDLEKILQNIPQKDIRPFDVIGTAISPNQEQHDVWQKYFDFHNNISQLLNEIESFKIIYRDDKEFLKEIAKAEKDFKMKYKGFNLSHKCSNSPQNWEIENQSCTECRFSYEDLLKFHDEIQKLQLKLFSSISPKSLDNFCRNFEILDSFQNTETIFKEMDTKLQLVRTLLSTYHDTHPDSEDKVKIKISLEKVE